MTVNAQARVAIFSVSPILVLTDALQEVEQIVQFHKLIYAPVLDRELILNVKEENVLAFMKTLKSLSKNMENINR